MPLYPMICGYCLHTFSLLRDVADAPRLVTCAVCGRREARQDYQQKMVNAGMVDGPSHAAVDEPSWPVDTSDKWKRRIVPNKAAWKERIKRSEGKIEDLS